MSDIDPDLRIPGYRIVRELGRGGMARVYLAIQESMEREVALKVMLPSLGAADPSFSERFLREARIVAKLAHPNVIAVIDVGVAGPYHYYSMEYHTGGDLKARIHAGMMPKLALTITRQVASALAFAHAKGYVHRDIKPENVLFRQDGTALLTDFGIAKATDAVTRMTATGVVIGTPHYMSPEQAQGHELDHRSDLYSLGVMFFEMLTGTVPYSGTSALVIGIKHLKEPVPPLPPPLHVYQPLLEKIMAKDPADRFQSGEELIAAIDVMSSGTHNTLSSAPTVLMPSGTHPTVITTSATGAVTKTAITGPAKRARQRAVLMAAAVATSLLVLAGILWLRTPVPAPVATTADKAPLATDSKPALVTAPPDTRPPDVEHAAPQAAAKAPTHKAESLPVPTAATPARVNDSQKLDSLLTHMQELLAPGGLTATKAGLATELYTEAARLAPSDPRVRNAPGQIADAYLKLATIRAEAKDYSGADNLVRKGLDLAPTHRLLIALQKDIAENRKSKRPAMVGF